VGLKAIGENCKELKEIYLTENEVTKEAIKALKEAIPGIKINGE
jgi:hypothetical protein